MFELVQLCIVLFVIHHQVIIGGNIIFSVSSCVSTFFCCYSYIFFISLLTSCLWSKGDLSPLADQLFVDNFLVERGINYFKLVKCSTILIKFLQLFIIPSPYSQLWLFDSLDPVKFFPNSGIYITN